MHSIQNKKMQSTQKKDTDKEKEYMDSLNELQKKALDIAKHHLGTSFHIQRSNGYHEWEETQKKN